MNAFTTTQTVAFAPAAAPRGLVRAARAVRAGAIAVVEAAEAYAVLEIITLVSSLAFSGIFIAAGFGYSLFH